MLKFNVFNKKKSFNSKIKQNYGSNPYCFFTKRKYKLIPTMMVLVAITGIECSKTP